LLQALASLIEPGDGQAVGLVGGGLEFRKIRRQRARLITTGCRLPVKNWPF
jgi:hypothetical protein